MVGKTETYRRNDRNDWSDPSIWLLMRAEFNEGLRNLTKKTRWWFLTTTPTVIYLPVVACCFLLFFSKIKYVFLFRLVSCCLTILSDYMTVRATSPLVNFYVELRRLACGDVRRSVFSHSLFLSSAWLLREKIIISRRRSYLFRRWKKNRDIVSSSRDVNCLQEIFPFFGCRLFVE